MTARAAGWADGAERLAATLPPLMVAAERLAASVSLGVHGRRKAGMGENFWQFRRYGTGDAAAAIDWRQSARTQHLYVREREWDAAQSVWLWREGAPGMRFGSGDVTKIERATVLALALASLLVRGGERVALLGEAEAPAASRIAIRRMAHTLCVLPPADDAVPPDAELARNALFVWFGDFLAEPEMLERAFRRLAHTGAGGYLVHIVDPAEEDFPYAGRTRFEAAEGGRSEIFGRAESVALAYRARFKAHADAVSALARKQGWSYLAHRTDRPPETALIALYAAMSGARKA